MYLEIYNSNARQLATIIHLKITSLYSLMQDKSIINFNQLIRKYFQMTKILWNDFRENILKFLFFFNQ